LKIEKKIDMETTARSGTPAGPGKSSLNHDALNQLLGQMVNDLGAAVNGALVVLGDGLGIYTALADIGPATSQELAKKTNLHERQLREWLSAQTASGYVSLHRELEMPITMRRRSFITLAGGALAASASHSIRADPITNRDELMLPEDSLVRTGGSRMSDIGGGNHVWTKK
jgi:hypothetical protein